MWHLPAAQAISATNGNCGWGFSGNWKDPSGDTCSGQYAYDDDTCDEACIVVEGIYWAIASYTGAVYFTERAEDSQHEWLMATPDAGMPVLPNNVGNAKTLEEGSADLYALVADTTSRQNKWIPSKWPDGKYAGPTPNEMDEKTCEASVPPTAAPTATPTATPTAAPTTAPMAGPVAAPTPAPIAAPTSGPTAAPTRRLPWASLQALGKSEDF